MQRTRCDTAICSRDRSPDAPDSTVAQAPTDRNDWEGQGWAGSNVLGWKALANDLTLAIRAILK